MVNNRGVEKYQSIELLRFLAASVVIFVHIPTVGVGNFGVDVFFAISGYVMMLSTEKSTKKFFVKRLIRILPTYYFFTLCVFCIALFLPNLLNGTTANLEHLIKSLLFIPFDKNGEGHFPILFLGWTLNYEMFFYAVFALSLMISHQYRALVSSLLLAAIFFYCRDIKLLPLSAYGNPIIFEFVLGMLTYEIYVKKNIRIALALAVIITLSIFGIQNIIDNRFVVYGIPAAAFVLLTIIALRGVKLPSVIGLLGGASYALYLTHPYVIQLFDKITHWFSAGIIKQSLALILSILIANLLAIALYKVMEIPVREYLRNKFI